MTVKQVFADGSVLSRIAVSVTSAAIIAMLLFGIKLYAGQQDRYTAQDARDDQSEQFLFNERVYSKKDVAAVQFKSIQDQLDRMEKKVDRLLAK
jgi:Tfp pilus assembly protein PilO